MKKRSGPPAPVMETVRTRSAPAPLRDLDDPRGSADICQQIDRLFEDLEEMAASELPCEKFHAQLLTRALAAAGASAGAIWVQHHGLAEFAHWHGDAALFDALTQNAEHTQLISGVIDAGRPQTATIALGSTEDGIAGPRCISATAPFSVDLTPSGAIELLLPATADTEAQERALDLTKALAELLADHYRRRQVGEYAKRAADWVLAKQFLACIHRSTLHDTAVALANEGRWFTGCDRASIVCRTSRAVSVLAVSGIDRFEPRSSLVRRARDLAIAVLKTNEPLWETGEPTDRPPQIDQPLQAYLEESHARAIVALPLQSEGCQIPDQVRKADAFGVIVLEWFTSSAIDEPARERIDLLARHGAIALSNALACERLPLIRINRVLAKLQWLVQARQLPSTLWALAGAIALAASLVFVPANFEIGAAGELQPAGRREIFAPADGVVDAVLVEHGDDVPAGAPLLRLRSPSLDFESARLQGEIQTAEKRLAALRSARIELDGRSGAQAGRALQLTADEEEVKVTLKSLHRQEQLLSQQQAELEIRSPLDGRILTWDVARQLTARPVERGQSLLAVGDVTGRWVIELHVPDHQIGYVLSAVEQAHRDGQAVGVAFLLNTDPGVTHEGVIERMALRSQIDDRRGESVVVVTVRFDEPLEAPRPGAGVVGKIQCGRRSLGYVWLHDAWNSIRRRVLF